MQKLKLSTVFSTFIAYVALMALGMFVMHHYAGSSYSSPDMPKTIFWFEIVMTVLVVTIYSKYQGGALLRQYSMSKPNKIFIVAYIVIVLNLGVMAYLFFTSDFTDKSFYTLGMILATTILVGISEEVMFRGIILPAFLSRMSKPLAILGSAILFSSLHSVNVLGGLSVDGMILQLINTFLVGIMFAGFAIEFGRIWPLVIVHFLIDWLLISGGYVNTLFDDFAIFNNMFGIAVGLVLLISFMFRKSNSA